MKAVESRICLRCGTAFITESRYVMRGGGRYCSRRCGLSAARKIPGQDPLDAFRRYAVAGIAPSDCWSWNGPQEAEGYGKFLSFGKTIRAHRFSFEIHKGPIPEGLGVLHRCDNPPCCNPAHLFVGGQKLNMEDASTKGRMTKHLAEQEALRQLPLGESILVEVWDSSAYQVFRRVAAERGAVVRTKKLEPGKCMVYLAPYNRLGNTFTMASAEAI